MGKFFKAVGLIILLLILIAVVIAGINTHYHNKDMMDHEQVVETTQSIQNLDISSRYHVIIKYGDEFHVSSHMSHNEVPEMNVENATLKVKTKSPNWFSKIFGGLYFGNKPDYIEITVPKGYQFEAFNYHGQNGLTMPPDFKSHQVKLSIQFGNLASDKLLADNIQLDTQFGNIGLSQTRANNIKLSTQFGNVSLQDVTAQTIDSSVQFGNTEIINETTQTYQKMKLDTQFGNIRLDNLQVDNLATSAVFGGVSKNNITEK